jgi:hypothetical protein
MAGPTKPTTTAPLTLSHLGGDALDQWVRVLRLHGRLAPTRANPPDAEPARSNGLDDLWTFFAACFHLGDWVSGAGVKSRKEVNDFIENSAARTSGSAPRNVWPMQICRDIANGTKHYRLGPNRPTTRNAHWTTTTVFTYESREMARWLFVDDNGHHFDLFSIADACLTAWQRFLDIGPGKPNPFGLRIRRL